jgi:hypothetical protein
MPLYTVIYRMPLYTNMSNLTQYVRKCKDCQGEILMKNLGDKWAALEKDGSTQHRCKGTQAQTQAVTATAKGVVTGGNESKVIEITTPKTVQNGNIDVHHTNGDKLIELQKRLSKLEAFVNSICESWIMNQQGCQS